MHAVKTVGLYLGIALANVAIAAADESFTGVFNGTGRACSGALYVRTQTIEWNSTYSVCKRGRYEILEKNLTADRKRIVYRLKNRSKHCRYEVVEVEHASGYGWNVGGYQSLEAFQKRDLPDWNNSALPERQVLSCPMIGSD